MPLVRLSVPLALEDAEVAAISTAVHAALMQAFDVPADDRFQVVTRHTAADMPHADEFLGIRHSDLFAVVQIVAAEGRSLEKKRALYREIAAGIARATRVRAEDVFIVLLETRRENFSFGNGEAQFAPAPPA